MASGVKISQLIPTTNLNGSDEFIVVQNGVTKRSTIDKIQQSIDSDSAQIKNAVNSLAAKVEDISLSVVKNDSRISDISSTYSTQSDLDLSVRNVVRMINSIPQSQGVTQVYVDGVSASLNTKIDMAADLLALSCFDLSLQISALSDDLSTISSDLSNMVYEVSCDLSGRISTVSAAVDAISDAVNLAMAAVATLNNLSALSSLSAIENSFEKCMSAVEVVDSMSAEVSGVAGNMFLNVVGGNYSNEPIVKYFNPLIISEGNQNFRRDANTFRNTSLTIYTDVTDDKFSADFFNMDGVPLRSGLFSIDETTDQTKLSCTLKTIVGIDSDVAVYASKKYFFNVKEDGGDYSVKAIVDCKVNGKKIPFAIEESGHENDSQNDFTQKFSGKLKAGSTIDFSIDNGGVGFTDYSDPNNPTFVEDFNQAVADGIVSCDAYDSLLGMIVANPTQTATEIISNAIFNGFTFMPPVTGPASNESKIKVFLELKNNYDDTFDFLNEIVVENVQYTVDNGEPISLASTFALSNPTSPSIEIPSTFISVRFTGKLQGCQTAELDLGTLLSENAED